MAVIMMKNALTFSYVAKKVAALLMFALSFALISNVANASKRVALVIGNSAYENAEPLINPRNDAEDLTVKLEGLGFDVVGGFDLDSRGMRSKVREFGEKLRGAEVALFFYAGHALQVNGRNYLAPVNTDIRNEADLDFETIPMDFVQRQMERETKTILLFLDACRNNPLGRSLRKSSRSTGSVRGLARETNSSEGTFIAFATQPNNVALDGDGRNSPFTTALLENIDRPGIEISTLMTDVRRQVFEATDEQQIPWINSSLLGRFYFKGSQETNEGKKVASLDDETIVQTDANSLPNPVQSPELTNNASNSNNSSEADKLLSMRMEQLAWESIKDSGDVDEIQAFLEAYGNGFFGNLGKLRLAKIEKQKKLKLASVKESEPSRKIRTEKVIRDQPEIIEKISPIVKEEKEQEITSIVEPTKIPEISSDVIIIDEPQIVTREITRQIQGELNRIGCVAGTPDGLWGRKSTHAVGLFAKHAELQLASFQPTHELLKQLQSYSQRICPAPQKIIRKQAKTCRSGQRLSRKGNCYWPKKAKTRTRISQPKQQKRGSGLLGGAVN